MTGKNLPAIEDVEKIDFDTVALSYRSDDQLRFRVLEPSDYPQYRPFDLVFNHPRSFTGPDEMSDVYFRVRGPSTRGDGVVYEFESHEIVPTDGRPYQVEVSGGSDLRVRFGRTVREVKARIVAARVTVEDAST